MELGKAAASDQPAAPERGIGGGVVHAPIQGVVRSLDPSLIVTVEQAEALPCVYETLTWAVEGTADHPVAGERSDRWKTAARATASGSSRVCAFTTAGD